MIRILRIIRKPERKFTLELGLLIIVTVLIVILAAIARYNCIESIPCSDWLIQNVAHGTDTAI